MTWTIESDEVTNFIQYSENFENWVKGAGYTTVVNNYGIDPFGFRSAAYVEDTSTTQYGQIYISLISNGNEGIDGNVQRTFSMFVKKDSVTTRTCTITMRYGIPAKVAGTNLNTSTGNSSLFGTTETGMSNTGSGIDDYGDYWRMWVTSRNTVYPLQSVMFIPANSSAIGVGGNVNNVGSCVIACAQLELGSDPTGYIKTEGEWVTKRKVGEWVKQ